jgi:hypothetical protein
VEPQVVVDLNSTQSQIAPPPSMAGTAAISDSTESCDEVPVAAEPEADPEGDHDVSEAQQEAATAEEGPDMVAQETSDATASIGPEGAWHSEGHAPEISFHSMAQSFRSVAPTEAAIDSEVSGESSGQSTTQAIEQGPESAITLSDVPLDDLDKTLVVGEEE